MKSLLCSQLQWEALWTQSNFSKMTALPRPGAAWYCGGQGWELPLMVYFRSRGVKPSPNLSLPDPFPGHFSCLIAKESPVPGRVWITASPCSAPPRTPPRCQCSRWGSRHPAGTHLSSPCTQASGPADGALLPGACYC